MIEIEVESWIRFHILGRLSNAIRWENQNLEGLSQIVTVSSSPNAAEVTQVLRDAAEKALEAGP